jgi:hypothetical protein
MPGPGTGPRPGGWETLLYSTQFTYTLSLRFSFKVSEQGSHPYNTTGKIIAFYIRIFIFFVRKLEDKNSAPDYRKHSLISIPSLLLPEYIFDSLVLFQNI